MGQDEQKAEGKMKFKIGGEEKGPGYTGSKKCTGS